ncbi:MAG: hypothetical protein LBP34_06875 [Flavobacteriaceae bacterium]|jgi:hypothetical protein|nr:hypothetical protein [Flavobacteriaceae bacterium]
MKYKEIISKIILLAFKKAGEESLHVLKTPLSKHISVRIENEYRVYISEKTFIRYYDKFVAGKEKATGTPNRKILDFLCKYIGFNDFIDFYHKKKKGDKTQEKEEGINTMDFTGKRKLFFREENKE